MFKEPDDATSIQHEARKLCGKPEPFSQRHIDLSPGLNLVMGDRGRQGAAGEGVSSELSVGGWTHPSLTSPQRISGLASDLLTKKCCCCCLSVSRSACSPGPGPGGCGRGCGPRPRDNMWRPGRR